VLVRICNGPQISLEIGKGAKQPAQQRQLRADGQKLSVHLGVLGQEQ
jgi:hypothetical protein